MQNVHLPVATLGEAHRRLATDGFSVLPDAGFTDGDEFDPDAVLRLAEQFGVPSSRDGGTAVWSVRPRTADPKQTFSLRSGAALLHTDAAYRADPEPRFALFCVRPGDDGGLTRLLRAADAVSGLDAETLAVLRRPVWRWLPPAVFGGRRDVMRPVLEAGGAIRWRPDNLDVSDAARAVAATFTEYVEQHPKLLQFPLPAGSMLVCDNRMVLHGRTSFSDPDRHLLRVRLEAR